MEQSIFLAKIIGCYLFAMSLTMLVRRSELKKTVVEFANNSALTFYSGSVTLIFGLLLVFLHPVYTGWPALVTIFGWLFVYEGIMKILFPSRCLQFWVSMTAGYGYAIWCWCWLIIGMLFLWIGFG